MVVDAFLKLAEMPTGESPIRTVVASPDIELEWGVDEFNSFTQPIQDKMLVNMQLDGVLGRTCA